ncbi:MAG: amidohydrolase [Rhizobacter sp.]|nr:amidohydrolase [Rhizobacter sp.]
MLKWVKWPGGRPAWRPLFAPLFAPLFVPLVLLLGPGLVWAQSPLDAELAPRVAAVQDKMVAWRRDIHQYPELSGQEARTAHLVAEHLRRLGLAVTTGVGGYGVVGVLQGGLPGKVVALRADMDALPVAEATGLPFASRAQGRHLGRDTPVMHACGHDGHTAILMGVAEVLAGLRAQIPGTVKFIFQPAEEGLPEDDPGATPVWGARAMVAQGVLDNPRVDAVFGLHISPNLEAGLLGYRSGPMMAGADTVHITITGEQTHGAAPWTGVDPIVAAAQVITGLQTIVSRQLDISHEPVVLTIAAIHGGNRENIVPESVEMLGTLRTFDEDMRADAKRRITATAQKIAEASGAKARVSFGPAAYSVTVNDRNLTQAMLPTLQRVSGGKAVPIPKISASEDFSEYQKTVPGLFYILGAPPAGRDPMTAPTNHSPTFDFDESAMPLGAVSLAALALDYLSAR